MSRDFIENKKLSKRGRVPGRFAWSALTYYRFRSLCHLFFQPPAAMPPSMPFMSLHEEFMKISRRQSLNASIDGAAVVGMLNNGRLCCRLCACRFHAAVASPFPDDDDGQSEMATRRQYRASSSPNFTHRKIIVIVVSDSIIGRRCRGKHYIYL